MLTEVFTRYGEFYEEGLTPVHNHEKKWGYANSRRELVIPYMYSLAEPFCEGLALVANDQEERGYIDEGNQLVIPFQWKPQKRDAVAGHFRDGRAIVCHGYKVGVIDREGHYVTPCQWRNVDYFYEGVARVQNDRGEWGYIDRDGHEVSPCRWKEALVFSEGMGVVKDSYKGWGAIDREGNMAVPLDQDRNQMFQFSNGLAECSVRFPEKRACVKHGANLLCGDIYSGFVDRQGRWAIPPQFWSATKFEGGLAFVQSLEGKWGIINKRGDLVVPCKWAKCHPGPHHGECMATIFSGRGRDLKAVNITFAYDDTGCLIATYYKDVPSPDYYPHQVPQMVKREVCRTNLSTYTDPNATQLPTMLRPLLERLEAKGYEREYLQKAFVAIILLGFDFRWTRYSPRLSNGRYGFVNDYGQWILPAQWQWAWGFDEGVAIVMDDNDKLHYINTRGEHIGTGNWTSATRFQQGVAVVRNDEGHYALIDQTGRFVIPYQEERIEIHADQWIYAWRNVGGKIVPRSAYELVRNQVKREEAYALGRDYVPQPINKTELKLPHEIRPLMRRMAKLGYTKNETEELLKAIAQAGFYVYDPAKHLPPSTTAEGKRVEKTPAPAEQDDRIAVTQGIVAAITTPSTIQLPEDLQPIFDTMVAKGHDSSYMKRALMLIHLLKYDFSWVHIGRREENGLYGFVNNYGQWVMPPKWKWAFGFDEGLAMVVDESGKYSYINTKGEIVIPIQWKLASWFMHGMAIVQNDDGLDALIDQTGHFIIPFQEEKEIYIDSNHKVWLIGKEDRKWTDINAFVESRVNRAEAYLYGRDFIPQPLESDQFELPEQVRPLLHKLEQLGYSSEESTSLLKAFAQAGYYVWPSDDKIHIT